MIRAAALLVLVLGCGPAPTLMDYHRQTLNEMAQGHMECPLAQIEFADTTPEDLRPVGNDPETRRYTTTGCEREAAFVCFTMRRAHNSEIPECRPLRRSGSGGVGGVYLGPVRVGQ